MNTCLLPCPEKCFDEGATGCLPASVVPHIAQRLRSTGYHALSAVKCEYHEGVVVLHGRVSSYYMKQVAQAVLMADPLIEDIVNLIEVSGVNHAA